MRTQSRAINLAYGGELGFADSAEIMAEIGIAGATAV